MYLFLYFLRLDSVSGRLQETNEEFEQARKKAKQAKIDFEFVKKLRSLHDD